MTHRMITTAGIGILIALGWTTALMAAEGEIKRAQFTSAVQNHEPVDEVTQLSTEHDRILFFMEVRDMENRTLTHRYSHDGEVKAEVDLDIGGPRWRTWSSKSLLSDWEGTWTVEVVDEEGEVHGSWSFEYGEASTDDDTGDEDDTDGMDEGEEESDESEESESEPEPEER